MNDTVILNGSVEDIIFQNEENGYCVFTISLDDNEEETVCVGTVPEIHKGESLKVMGSWIVHPTYGRQLSVDFYEKTIPTTVDGIEKYLASGVIKGIGKKTAEKIVLRFGEATFYVIEEKPERLVEIKGINHEKAMKINEIFREQHELRRAMIMLQKFGISPTFAMKIYKKYKQKTFDIVNTNPYKLADEIMGVGFKMADKLAAAAGISEDSPFRMKSGIKYILNMATSDGHVYLPQEILLEKSKELLNIEESVFENVLQQLQLEHQIWREQLESTSNIYLNTYYYSEIYVAKKLLELLMMHEETCEDAEEIIAKTERKQGVELAENQRLAVKEALEKGVLVITGGPGTGKTTTINTIIEIFNEKGKSVILAAPTGRAAKRMSESTNYPAQTLHRLLGINFINEDEKVQNFLKNEDDPIEADVIIVDESSMIDILLMNSLLKAVSNGTRVIFVGDIDQLPSVGAGNVLNDIIKSEIIAVVRLNEIFRQAKESAIITNAHKINSGETPVLNEKSKDFFFVKRAYSNEVVYAIKELVTKRLPSFSGCDPKNDIQVLTPMKKGDLGVFELNKVLQGALNPPSNKKREKQVRASVFREGDKVMQIKNNYNLVWKCRDSLGKVTEEDMGVFNGDCGVISKIEDYRETITVIFDENKYVEYDYTQLDELELSYAITIHKSQGSEYPVVVIPIHSGPPMLLSRNLLYTAVTRAKNLVVLVGITDTMTRMVNNNREIKRFSSLDRRIVKLYDFINQ